MQVSFQVPGRITGKSRPKFTTGALKHVVMNALESVRDRAAKLAETANDASSTAGAIRSLSLFAPGAKFDGNPAPYVHAYTPAETKEMEAHIRSFAMAAMQGRAPMEGPLWLFLHTRQIPPVSWAKKKRAETFFVTTKPDGDNVLKTVKDALNSVCWIDDSQVAIFLVSQTYTLDGPEEASIAIGQLDGRAIAMPLPGFLPPEMPLLPGMEA